MKAWIQHLVCFCLFTCSTAPEMFLDIYENEEQFENVSQEIEMVSARSDSSSDMINPPKAYKPTPYCESKEQSCLGRCDISSPIFGGKVRHSYSCKCDKLCVVFRDCCLDFLDECYELGPDEQSALFVDSVASVKKYMEDTVLHSQIPGSDSSTVCFTPLGKLLSNSTLEGLLTAQGCFQCVDLKMYQSSDDQAFHVVTKCPIAWEDQSIKTSCDSSNNPPLFNIPVQDREEPAIIYRNIHCAICHSKEVDDIEQWSTFISCPSDEDLAKVIRHSSHSIQEYIQKTCSISHAPLNADWGQTDCSHQCKYKTAQFKIENISRRNDTLYKQIMCQTYLQPVSPESDRNMVYRNTHCASLDGATNLTCSETGLQYCTVEHDDTKAGESFLRPGTKPLSVLFNFRDSTVSISNEEHYVELSSEKNDKCSEDEVYSFLSHECEPNFRTKISTDSNIAMRIQARLLSHVCGASLSDVDNVLGSTLFSSVMNTECVIPGDTYLKLTGLHVNATDIKYQESSILVDLLLTKTEDLDTRMAEGKISCGWWHLEHNDLKYSKNVSGNTVSDIQHYCESKVDILFEAHNLKWEIFVSLLENLRGIPDKYSRIFYSTDRGVILSYENIRFTNYASKFNMTCSSEETVDVGYTVEHDRPWTLSTGDEPRNISLTNSLFSLNHHFVLTNSKERHEWKICHHTDGFDNCTAVLSTGEKEYWAQDGHLYITAQRHNYKFSKYWTINDTMYYCADAAIKVPVFLQDNPLLTTVGLSSSLVALLFVICTYALFSPLRNVPGKIVLGLASSLFCAMFLFLFGIGQTSYPVLCSILAAILHFFWLSAFFWTTVLSFNLAQTFGSKTLAEKKHFLWYSAYSFIGPALIVLATLVEGFVSKSDSSVHGSYGNAAACWISRRWVNIIAFGCPVGMTVLVNTGLFIYTIRGLYKVSKITKLVRNTENRGQSTFLYFKLSLIMGLSWALFYLSSAVEDEILQALSILLNSLQGVFLFLVFICNKRVYNLYKDIICRCSNERQNLSPRTDTTLSDNQTRIRTVK